MRIFIIKKTDFKKVKMDFILIIIGFALLIVGAHYLVDGASGLAKRYNVPDLVIGLTVVAFGTSTPELVVNVVASLNPATTDIALTNIIGSNFINTFIILGFAAVIYPVTSQASSRKFDIPLNLISALVLLGLLWVNGGVLNWISGIILLLIFSGFMYRMLTTKNEQQVEHPEHYKPMKVWVALLMVAGGLAALVAGAQLIVPSATRIASSWGISQAIIGVTIVALGTSLPELATSAVAAFKKNSDIALGNVIGSNIFNIFFILGISSLIRPLPAYANIYTDLIWLIASAILVILVLYLSPKKRINRWVGLLFLVLYAIYVTILIG